MVRSSHPILSAVVFICIAILFSLGALVIKDIHTEWRAGHLGLFQALKVVNWPFLRVSQAYNAVRVRFASNRPGLPTVRLYISEKSERALQSALPYSVKKWQKGRLQSSDGKMHRIKLRHRGDNPVNWAFPKKSWRLKMKKNDLVGNVRSFDYLNFQSPVMIEGALLRLFAQDIGLLVAPSRLVEMFVNGQNRGVYLEVENLDESFLRHNGIMPVNMYKGEQRMSEKRYGVDIDLFNSPALWRKIASNNIYHKADTRDLQWVIQRLRDAETSPLVFANLHRTFPYETWATFAAYEAIAQNHFDTVHNARIVIDTWSGHVLPVVQDPQSRIRGRIHSRQGVLRLLEQDSAFLWRKLQAMYRLLDEEVMEKQVLKMHAIQDRLSTSIARDPYISQQFNSSETRNLLWSSDKATTDDAYMSKLLDNANTMKSKLMERPKVGWASIDGAVSLTIEGLVPMDGISLARGKGAAPAKIVAWDRDDNGILSEGDMILQHTEENGSLLIDSVFLSSFGRFNTPRSLAQKHYGYIFRSRPTLFKLVADVPLSVVGVSARNALTRERYDVSHGDLLGTLPDRWNHPITKASVSDLEVWENQINIDSDRIVDTPVRIAPGAELIMGEGASLIFRSQLVIAGTESAPVTIRGAGDSPWGTVALIGKSTKGSRLSHFQMHGGSGDHHGLVRFSAMLSIHDTEDILVEHAVLKQNYRVDDMAHVVYSKNIVFSDVVFSDARADALDIDISDAEIVRGRFENAGNDAIDFMSSEAVIRDTEIYRSGDKGISVGENSTILVHNTRIADSKIGVQSKDASAAFLSHSEILRNATQLHSFKKNWRYGTGGTIISDKSIFRGDRHLIEAGEQSRIVINDSGFSGEPETTGQVKFSGDVDSGPASQARPTDHTTAIGSILRKYGLPQKPEHRGILR